MGPHGSPPDEQGLADLRVGPPLGQEAEDLDLTGAQRRAARPLRGPLLGAGDRAAPGEAAETWLEFTARDGRLDARMRAGEVARAAELAFYRDGHALALDTRGEPSLFRADFVPGPDGRIAWFRFGGRLHARQG